MSAAQLELVEATLAIVAELQGAAVTEAHAKLAELAPAAAQLVAADQVRLGLIGERFPMPRGIAPPFQGLALIRAFVESIPERLRPPELTETSLLNAAREISGEILSQIKEIQS